MGENNGWIAVTFDPNTTSSPVTSRFTAKTTLLHHQRKMNEQELRDGSISNMGLNVQVYKNYLAMVMGQSPLLHRHMFLFWMNKDEHQFTSYVIYVILFARGYQGIPPPYQLCTSPVDPG